MNTLVEKKILIGITGGIAAYKTVELIRRLREQGAHIKVVMTNAAQEFITPLTMQAISGQPVYLDLLDSTAEAAMSHIELARWADLIVIAPASADFIARIAHGFANDLLSTLCLASVAPIILAPAMNQQMWLHVATQENIATLSNRGLHIFGPAAGSQACGEFGPGRMLEPSELIPLIHNFFLPKLLAGKKILITAGPTREAIDPIRYLTNRSSGKMGFAMASAAAALGAEVILIAGPVHLTTPNKVTRINIESAAQMYQTVHEQINEIDIFIATAAVADYRNEDQAPQKIKKLTAELTLKLVQNPDVLASVAELSPRPFLVGFAAETEDLLTNAKKKLINKKLDIIVANQVNSDYGFDSDDNQVTVLWQKGMREFPRQTKQQLAYELLQLIVEHYHDKNPT